MFQVIIALSVLAVFQIPSGADASCILCNCTYDTGRRECENCGPMSGGCAVFQPHTLGCAWIEGWQCCACHLSGCTFYGDTDDGCYFAETSRGDRIVHITKKQALLIKAGCPAVQIEAARHLIKERLGYDVHI